MPYIFLFLLTFLFTACTNNGTNSPSLPSELPTTNQTSDVDDLKIAPENSIVGEYTLKRGAFSHGTIYQDIDEGYLVIEELDVNNYGYYYVTIVGDITPETHSGIFYEKGGKFLQKVIYDDANIDEANSNSTHQSHIATIDNLKINYDNNVLKIVIDSTKHETTIWNRDDGTATKSEKMKKALKEAKQEYIDFYKNKCVGSSKLKCSEHEYTPVND